MWNTLADFGKKIRNYVFTREFSCDFKTTTTKWMFVLYCCVGGFFFDNRVCRGFRRVWLAYHVYVAVLVGTCYGQFFSRLSSPNYYREYLMASMFLGGTLASFFTHVSMYAMRVSVSPLLAILNEDDEEGVNEQTIPGEVEEIAAKTSDVGKMLWKFVFLVISIVGAFAALSFNSFIELSSVISDDRFMFYYFPTYYPYEHTVLAKWAIHLVQLTAVPLPILVASAGPSFFYISTSELYDKFIRLSKRLRSASYDCYRQLKVIEMSEVAMDEERMPRSTYKFLELSRRRKIIVGNLMDEIVAVFKRLQRLHSVVKRLTGQMGLLVSSVYLAVWCIATVIGYLTLSCSIKEYWQASTLVAPLAGFIVTLGCWFVWCCVGDMFANMHELISDELYDSPWYMAEPEDRKVILIFLTMVQRPFVIYVLKIFPTNLSTFPRTLNKIYSNSKVLRTLQMKMRQQ